jgi:CHRD domain
MKRRFWMGTALAAVSLLCLPVLARAQDFSAKFSGFQELGALNAETGAILSTGQATLKLRVDKNAQTLTYTLTYSGLTNVLQAHVHFGKEHVPGGVMVFFCTNLGNGPAGTPACPDDTTGEVTVTGTVTATGVVGPAAQNITAGDFAGVVSALESDSVYGNIHTKQFPAGEIRGQVHAERHDDRGRDKDDDH